MPSSGSSSKKHHSSSKKPPSSSTYGSTSADTTRRPGRSGVKAHSSQHTNESKEARRAKRHAQTQPRSQQNQGEVPDSGDRTGEGLSYAFGDTGDVNAVWGPGNAHFDQATLSAVSSCFRCSFPLPANADAELQCALCDQFDASQQSSHVDPADIWAGHDSFNATVRPDPDSITFQGPAPPANEMPSHQHASIADRQLFGYGDGINLNPFPEFGLPAMPMAGSAVTEHGQYSPAPSPHGSAESFDSVEPFPPGFGPSKTQ